jgi:Ca-activated chloride channel family protein
MGLVDIAPSRLAAARDAAIDIIELAGSRPLGLIVYAGDAYLAGPLTFDKQHTLAFLDSLEPGDVPIQGSNLKRALALSSAVIRESALSRARLFVLSDATTDVKPLLPVAASLSRDGHRIDVLSFASDTDQDKPADFTSARALAESGGGIALNANALGTIDLAALTENASWKSDRFVQSSLATLIVQNLSHWVLLLAIPLVLLMFGRRTA